MGGPFTEILRPKLEVNEDIPAELLPRRETVGRQRKYAFRPWCRVCKKRVDRFVFDAYAGGFYGFYVECHGEKMGGLVPSLTSGNVAMLEVFCHDDPHVRLGPWWYVNRDGGIIQESYAYIHSNVGGSVFMSPTAAWLRKNAAPLMISMGIAAQLVWLLR